MTLRELCEKYHIRFKKGLGQNLLLDDNINRIMVESAGLTREDDVIEVGAGLGALTAHIHPLAGRVLAVEIDPSFMPCLEDRFESIENVRLFRGDILNHSLPKFNREFLPEGTSFKMISNLPYYITTPILFHFLESPTPFQRIVVMVQSEVAQRMLAPIDTPEYGVLGLSIQCRAEVDIIHPVPRTCFIPQPKVDSCIIRLRLYEKPRYTEKEIKLGMALIRAAFTQRRKMLRNSLTKSGLFGAPKTAVLEAFEATGINPDRRPQTITLEEFMRLAQEVRVHISNDDEKDWEHRDLYAEEKQSHSN